MKTYKNYPKNYIGSSDIASLVMAGYRKNQGLCLEALHFGGDGSYYAYIVDADAIIGDHYKKIADFNAWLKIYDDDELTACYKAESIIVYRAREHGCIIQLINEKME